MQVAGTRATKKGLEDKYIFPLLVWGVVIGFVCAKILYYITILDEIRSDPRIMLNIFDGFVVYGGIIGGILAGYCSAGSKDQFLGISGSGSAVHCAGPGLRKVGCFLAGCCYGVETDGPLAIVFTDSQFAPNGVPLVPTQLYSTLLIF